MRPGVSKDQIAKSRRQAGKRLYFDYAAQCWYQPFRRPIPVIEAPAPVIDEEFELDDVLALASIAA
ncbi:MAG TPA: hypothetical protein VGO01_11560 [Bradyrhizobium sp.]|nr:hypothetical protein [Bradyrhizobium sp.]